MKDLTKNIENLIKRGKAKRTKEGTEITLEKYKILGDGELKEKLIVKAFEFSKSAKEKIEKSGGKAISLKKENAA